MNYKVEFGISVTLEYLFCLPSLHIYCLFFRFEPFLLQNRFCVLARKHKYPLGKNNLKTSILSSVLESTQCHNMFVVRFGSEIDGN